MSGLCLEYRDVSESSEKKETGYRMIDFMSTMISRVEMFDSVYCFSVMVVAAEKNFTWGLSTVCRVFH